MSFYNEKDVILGTVDKTDFYSTYICIALYRHILISLPIPGSMIY